MSERGDILIVSNRLPVHRVRAENGGADRWETSPGGLVSALKPILQTVGSTWIGWTGVDDDDRAPFEHDGIRNHPVAISGEEMRGYYEGFSNRTIWPLYHDAIRPAEYHRSWWRIYTAVNQRFAQAAAECAKPGGLVWVHDYQLQLVPEMLRALRPDLRIGFFLHIPFPPQELFAQLPWRRHLLRGLLGADVIGFQTRVASENFVQLCRRFLNIRDRGTELQIEGRSVIARAFPISIDFGHFDAMAGTEAVAEQARMVRARLGDRRMILGVDRLDYTKGIDIRMRAFQDLLHTGECRPDDTVFVQVAVPSREKVEEYQELRSNIEEMIGRINGKYGQVGRTPIQYLHRGVSQDELVALYLLADVMAVTPARDGMNLVAKEYVACRRDDTGVLVLSEFTGAAHELTDALLVNPHDVDDVAGAIKIALQMKPDEAARRMHSLREVVRQNDVHRWARSFYEELGA
tara:strand:- start:34095 stop:35480 length:1386 start_codon:yes stop_codon:yes gene_type:complete